MNDHAREPDLGTVEELPDAYRAQLAALNVAPAWTMLRALTPPHAPIVQAQAIHWRYADLKPQLLRAAELVPMAKAERRVLALVNPGLPPEKVATLPTLFFGLQLIMPGERAPKHMHTPAATRVFLEGEGAYTTVQGEKIVMEPGDVVLTPPWRWHDHGHEGREPAIWMDVLDHPMVVPNDLSYVVPGDMPAALPNTPDSSDTFYRCAGLVPYRLPNASPPEYPMTRFRWTRVREALQAVADATGRERPVHQRYVDPESGASVLRSLDFSARLLRPGETVVVAPSSLNQAFLAREGEMEIEIDGAGGLVLHRCTVNDAVVAPVWSTITLRNLSDKKNAALIQVDDGPMQVKLGYFQAQRATAANSLISS